MTTFLASVAFAVLLRVGEEGSSALPPFYPPVCITEGQRCYRTTDSEQQNKYSNCCTSNGGTNGTVVMACQGGIWSAVCTRCPANNCATRLPLYDPKGVQGVDWNVVTVPTAGSPNDDCTAVANLGPKNSASTGYSLPFPQLGVITNILNPAGRESEISLLVGGNYRAPLAAEIEGNIVVLGDFIIGKDGTNSLGTYIPVHGRSDGVGVCCRPSHLVVSSVVRVGRWWERYLSTSRCHSQDWRKFGWRQEVGRNMGNARRFY